MEEAHKGQGGGAQGSGRGGLEVGRGVRGSLGFGGVEKRPPPSLGRPLGAAWAKAQAHVACKTLLTPSLIN